MESTRFIHPVEVFGVATQAIFGAKNAFHVLTLQLGQHLQGRSMIASMLLPWLKLLTEKRYQSPHPHHLRPCPLRCARSSGRSGYGWDLAFNPRLAIARQSFLAPGDEAQGVVNSIYSTPNASRRVRNLDFCSVVKNALTNCSPSRKVDSIMENFLQLISISLIPAKLLGLPAICGHVPFAMTT